MKKIIAWVLLVCVLTAGCGTSGQAVAEVIYENGPNVANDYQVVVVGGEPEGVAAAVSAARNGMKTLLIEDDGALGGLMTLGGLNFIDMCHGRDGTLLTQGIFKEFYDAVGGTAFDITLAKNTFLKMVTDEPNLTLRVNSKVEEPIMDGNKIIGVRVREGEQTAAYYGQAIIDATVDADIAAMSGVPYTFAGEDIGEKDKQMGVTLVFELSGVNWNKVYSHLKWQKFKGKITKTSTDMDADDRSAWGYTEEGYGYVPQDEMMRLRGFNIARQDNGNVLINALIIFGVDVLDPVSRAEGIARGQAELGYILPYIRENFKGFEKAQLVSTAEQLYVRESRHIIGEYQLTIDDVLENRDQWDKIAIGSYPVDVQPTVTQRYGTVIGNPDRYAIPFRSLVPLEVENLLVVGRSASYHSLAAGSARVIPIGMASGEAAGVAASYAINNEVSFREMTHDKEAIAQVQQKLKDQGAYLADIHLPEETVMSHWAYPGVKILRSLGLLDGGYNNNYRLDEPLGKWRYQNMLNGVLKKAGIESDYIEVNDDPPCRQVIGTVARQAAMVTSGDKIADDYQVQIDYLMELGIMNEELAPYFTDKEKNPQVAEVIMLVANLYQYMK